MYSFADVNLYPKSGSLLHPVEAEGMGKKMERQKITHILL
jgi:hypothetical protein